MLPADTDRVKVKGLIERVISPYVLSGGGLSNALTNTPGGFQAITSDLVTAMNDVPFAIPPYFALLGRAVAVLEGIALTGNPDYRIVMEGAYPFVARKLMKEDAPALQKALSEILYGKDGRIKLRRLPALLSSAMGAVPNTGAFVDLDALPEDGLPLREGLQYVLSPDAQSQRDGVLAA